VITKSMDNVNGFCLTDIDLLMHTHISMIARKGQQKEGLLQFRGELNANSGELR